MVRSFKYTSVPAAVLAMALALTACGGSSDAASGTYEEIRLDSGWAFQVFVPDGWYLGNMVDTGTVAPTEQNTIYYVANSAVIPVSLMAVVGEDHEARDEMSRLVGEGGALAVIFTPVQSCASAAAGVDESIEGLIEGGENGGSESLEDGVGDGGVIAWASYGDYESTRYFSRISIGNGECHGFSIANMDSVGKSSETRDMVSEVAKASTLPER